MPFTYETAQKYYQNSRSIFGLGKLICVLMQAPQRRSYGDADTKNIVMLPLPKECESMKERKMVKGYEII